MASMDRQQTEQINNLAGIGFFDAQYLQLLQGATNYFDENPKSEACAIGRKSWDLKYGDSQAAAYYNGSCRLELGSAGEEMFYMGPSMNACTTAHNLSLHQNISINNAEGNMNSQNYIALSSNVADFLSSGNGASASNYITPVNFNFLHGAQSSGAGAQRFDNVVSTNPNLPLAAPYWGNGDNVEADSNTVNVLGCSWNEQASLPARRSSSLIQNHEASHDFLSFYDQRESVNCRRETADDEQMRQTRKSVSLDSSNSNTAGQYSAGGVGVLRSCKYRRPLQQLLEEVCNLKSCLYDTQSTRVSYSKTSRISHDPFLEMSATSISGRCHFQMQKARLIGMAEELDQRYQQYQDQIQLIVTSFESATGVGAAAPYTALAKKLISRQFRVLRDAIGEHIHGACRMLGDDISSVAILNKGETPRLRILDQRLRHHRTLQQVSMLPQHHQGWRPQRGLPERSVTVLRAWLFEHFLHPYPNNSEKLMLARLTGLTKAQVTNWFINARVRLWKPMVEQMYTEERKEVESQNLAGAERYEDTSRGPNGYNVMALATHENPPKLHHYQHLVHDESNSGTSHSSGVSLTLALEHSSSVELEPNTYKPTYHYLLHPVSGDPDYNIPHAFS